MNKKKIVFVAVLLVLCGAVFLVREHGKIINPLRETATTQAAKLRGQANKQKLVMADGLSLSRGEAGKLEWVLTTEHMLTSGDSGIVTVSKPFLTFFSKNERAASGEETTTVQSLRGEVDRVAGDMRFLDDVLVVSKENNLTTSQLEFVAAEKIIYCPEQTYFSSPSMQGVAGKAALFLDNDVLNASEKVSVDMLLVPVE
ncbi:MAG: LPS export ABC transporter periplasmic protein LptC [Deltaproteobacteria bacterium]|jgi:lipopolysaccharide export system protein LptC|nr:LPS export ABC transporter periplasmic protein LptC [Deltaproteobacteria bacterium]